MEFKTTFIELDNGTQICAPADESMMTNFVLQEQGDWFEEDIHFVRSFIQESMNALDIGANYGLYSTAIAANLGKDGKLWCFEPTQDTADALRQTISKNGFDHKIELIQAGLSDHIGKASFFTSTNSELNSLTENEFTGGKQTIELLTLDSCLEQYQWSHIDFIKLDAEGEELNILKAASKTLDQCSPLIMFEIKHGATINKPLVEAFQALGYDSYYLIPGLNVLCPFDLTKPQDPFRLNLFCCKKDKAEQLVRDGVIVQDTSPYSLESQPPVQTLVSDFAFLEGMNKSDSKLDNSSDKVYLQTYSAYANSRDTTLSIQDRVRHLFCAFDGAVKLLDLGDSNIGHLSTLARISIDIGHRHTGNNILKFLINNYLVNKNSFALSDVFLPASQDFECVSIGQSREHWLLASIVHQHIIQDNFSCYYTKNFNSVISLFTFLEQTGYLLPHMKKRLDCTTKYRKKTNQ